MKVLIATDAWRPQINGVVRTLEALAAASRGIGVETRFLTPEGFPSFPLPTYPGLRCAIASAAEIARRIEAVRPDAIHVATEGTIGWAVRRYCRARGLAFTSSFTTRFPEYLSARFPIPVALGYLVLRKFHAAAAATMVATPSLAEDLGRRGFLRLKAWSRGVDTALFRPDQAEDLGLPRPIFLSVGRIAVEKNLEAFLALDLPGTKVVVGEGPQERELRARHPGAVFLGPRTGRALAACYAAADVFVFPSLTDTFGVVQLEALACGVPVAAFPATGPADVIGDAPVGALDTDLRRACLRALSISRAACRIHAERFSWDASARQFAANLIPIGPHAVARAACARPAPVAST